MVVAAGPSRPSGSSRSSLVAARVGAAISLPWNDAYGSAWAAPTSSMRRPRRASRHTVRRRSTDLGIGGGVAVFDCDGDGTPGPVLRRRQRARAARTGTTARPAARCASRRSTDAATDIDGVTGAYPLDVDGDGARDLAVLRDGGLDAAARPRRLPVRAARTSDGRSTRGRAGRRRSARPGRRCGACRRSRSGTTCELDAIGPGELRCDDNAAAPARGRMAAGTRAPITLTPGLLRAVDAVQRLGPVGAARPPGQQRSAVLRRRNGEEQLWRIAPGEPPRPYTSDDGWVQMQIWGMGIASYDLTGDGYPEVYLTSQGANRLQTLSDGPDRADLPRHRRSSAASNATRPYAGGDPLPSTAWHPEFADVNNDGLIDLFVVQGQRGQAARLRDAGPEQPSPRPARRDVRRRRAAAPGIVEFEPGPRCGTCRPQPRRPSRPRRGQPRTRPSRLWRNVGAGSAASPAAMGHWLALRRAAARRRTATRSGPGSRSRSATRSQRREITVGGGHAGGQLGWLHVGLGSATRRRRARDLARRFGRAVAPPCRPTVRRRASAGPTRVEPWTPPPMSDAMTARSVRAARRGRRCPISGCRRREPEIPRPLYAERLERLRDRAEARGYDRLRRLRRPRAQRQPRLADAGSTHDSRRRSLVVGADGTPAILVGNECWGMAGAAPLPMRRAPVPGPQPAGPAARPLAAAGRDPRRPRDRPRWPRRRRRLEDRSRHAGPIEVPGVPRRRAAPPDRSDGRGRERHRPADRRRDGLRVDQRGRPARRAGIRGLPDVAGRAAT